MWRYFFSLLGKIDYVYIEISNVIIMTHGYYVIGIFGGRDSVG